MNENKIHTDIIEGLAQSAAGEVVDLGDFEQYVCSGGAEVAVDWETGEVLHEGDDDWHPWDPAIYSGSRDESFEPRRIWPEEA